MSTLQQGTLFLEQTVEGATMKSPLPEVTLYFLQNGVEKTNTVTNKEGKFSITLPVGAYSITAEKVGGYNGKIPLAAGQTIQLTRNSPKNAVEKFITAAIGADVDHELIKQIQDIAKQAEQSAKDAKDAANSIPKVIPVNKGGTGATTAAKARENLGVTDIVNKKRDISDVIFEKSNFANIKLYSSKVDGPGKYISLENSSGLFHIYSRSVEGWDNTQLSVRLPQKSGVIALISDITRTLSRTTTVDTNGFLKAASPVLKLFDDRIEHNDQFIGKPRFRKLETGVYEITNTLGLAKEGWTIETPKDRHGRPYFHVIVQESHGRVVLSVHDEYEVRKTETIRDIYGEEQKVEVVEKMLGEARDIKPHERWIDLRFHEEPEEPIDEDEEWMKYLTPEELEEMNNPSVES